jgi:uncharacterized repeat protein (TIGR03843 family)
VTDDVLELLSCGDLEVLGLLPYATNATFLAEVRDDSRRGLAVYKPRRGERPLWDFPSGTLCRREFAAWLVSEALGWGIVPPTVLRDGPAGFGAVQLYVIEDEEVDVRDLVQTHPDELRLIALFDVITNNADRKAGHLVVDNDGKLWGVDHGICFSDEPKLRTVVWAFEGEPVTAASLKDLARFAESDVGSLLGPQLSPDEITALLSRTEHMLRSRRFPSPPPGGRHVPWPPW